MKRTIPSLLALLFTGLAPVAQGANIDHFLVFNFDHRNDGSVELPGRLYVPHDYDPVRAYPIVIYFHGIDRRGTNNTSQVSEITQLLEAAQNPEHPFFIYAPQLPTGSWPGTAIDRAMRMLSRAGALYHIDPTRVYAFGISLGGGGVWDSISRYDGAFAGAVPIAGVSYNPPYALLEGKPIWIFHGRYDSIVPVSDSRNRVNGMRQALGKSSLDFPVDGLPTNHPDYNNGAPLYEAGSATFYDDNRFRYTEFTQGGHTQAFWDRCLSDPHLYPWLFANPNPLPQASLQMNESLWIDLGDTRVATSGGVHWNAPVATGWDTPGTAIAFGKNGAGRVTPVSLDIVRPFAGATSGGSTALYPDGIGNDGWRTPENLAGELRLRGLLPNGIYDLEIYASHPDDDGGRGRRTLYRIGKASQELEAHANATSQAIFQAVKADGRGEITLSVAPAPGGSSPRFGQINTLKVTLVAPAEATDAMFEQDFSSSTALAAYLQDPPQPTSFLDISAAPQGGQWTVEEGTLRLLRGTSSAPGNEAGFLRPGPPSPAAPKLLTARFSLGVDPQGTHTFGVLGTLELGDFTETGAYAPLPAKTTQALAIRGNGTDRYRLAIGDLAFGDYAAGTVVDAAWMLNQSAEPVSYATPDGGSRLLAPGCSDLWIDSTLVYDNRPRPAGLEGSGLGGLRFRTATPHAVAFLFDHFRLEEGLPQHRPFFAQDFSASPNPRDYVDIGNPPAFDRFSDLSAEPDGGSWSIAEGKLKLHRPTNSVASNNAAGWTKLRPQMEASPEVVCARFEIMIDLHGALHNANQAILEFGDFTTVTDYSSSPAPITEQLIFRSSGTKGCGLQINGDHKNIFFPSGSTVAVSWMINRSSQPQSYRAPDGSWQSVAPGTSDLWAGNTLIHDNIVGATGGVFTGTRLGGFRFRVSSTIAADITLDHFTVEAGLPGDPLHLSLAPDSFESWKAVALDGLPPQEQAPGADPDGDGLANLLEYGLDLDPKTPGVSSAPAVSEVEDLSNAYLALAYLRPTDKPGLTYEVEASSDLVHWSAEETLPYSTTPQDDSLEWTVVRDTLASDDETPRYLRLKISDGAQTAATVPAGLLPLAIAGGGATTALAVPLSLPPVYKGRVGAVSASTITVPGAAFGELASPENPHLLRFLGGAQEGRTLLITANTAETVTLDTFDRSPQKTDLDALPGFRVEPGDPFQISPAETLGTLLGNSPETLPIRSGATAFHADTVQLWNGVTGRNDTYFFNSNPAILAWNRSGAGTAGFNHQPILPGDGLLLTTKPASTGGTLLMEGEVPVSRLLLKHPGSSAPVLFGHPFPVSLPLSSYQTVEPGLGTLRKGTNAFGADTLQLYNPVLARYDTFFPHNDLSWRLSGDLTQADHASRPVDAGSGLLLIRKAPASGAESFLPFSLPPLELYAP